MKLEILLPFGKIQEVEVSGFPADIGRSPNCDVAIEHRKVSRRHARLVEADGRIRIVDLGSTNGVRVNGSRTQGAVLQPGDEIEVGPVKIRVLEAPKAPSHATPAQGPGEVAAGGEDMDGSPEPPRARPLVLFRLRRTLSWLGPLVIVGGVVGLLAVWIHRQDRFLSVTPRFDLATAAPGLGRELAALEGVAARSAQVTVELVARAEDLAERYRRALPRARVNPADDLLVKLRSRRDLELQNRVFAVASVRDRFLNERRYGEALRVVEAAARELGGEGPELTHRLGDLADGTRRAIEETFQAFEAELSFVEFPQYEEEFRVLLERGLASFAGTAHVPRIRERLVRYERSLEAHRRARERLAERMARQLVLAGEDDASESPAVAERPARVGLSGLLAAPIRAGALASQAFPLEGRRVSPIEVRDDLILVGTVGGKRIEVPFAEIPPQVQLSMAASALSGEALLRAALHGFAWGLESEAGKLLFRFLTEGGGARLSRQQRIDEVLSTVRGLDTVPEGGFRYDPDHGWEDAQGRRDRTALQAADTLARRLPRALTTKNLQENFERLASLVERDDLSPAARAEVRQRAISTLAVVATELATKIQEGLQRVGLERLGQLKVELNRRRAAALEVIRDASTYLAENHPDYPKGDEVNGQAEVDRRVDAVRELWEDPARYTLRIDRQTRLRIDRLRLIRSEFHARLDHTPNGDPGGPFEDLWNNLHQTIGLTNFALDAGEVELRSYNRRVATYNRELHDVDLPGPDRAHVVFVNDYREMLGLRRLFIDLRLCRAARKHSEVCDGAGRIWHSGPDGSPSSRARAEGFPTGVGENVAIGYGNPEDIWERGWYRASDHHRNAIGAGWTCVGYGYAGRVGTQNFAAIGPPF